MKYYVLTDIHGNLPALIAVLRDIEAQSPDIGYTVDSLLKGQRRKASRGGDRIVSLGDLIGRGPFPGEVVSLIDRVADISIIGNHDDMGIDYYIRRKVPDWLRGSIQDSVRWSAEHISPDEAAILKRMQRGKWSVQKDGLVFAHSNPHRPTMMVYVDDALDAKQYFFDHRQFMGKTFFGGHTHHARLWVSDGYQIFGGDIGFYLTEHKASYDVSDRKEWSALQETPGERFSYAASLADSYQSFIQVPSLGNPRDRIPYAGYVAFDTRTGDVEYVRVPYDLTPLLDKMRESGFDNVSILKMSIGM